MQFTRVNSNPDETNGLLGVIDKVGLTYSKVDKLEEAHAFLLSSFLAQPPSYHSYILTSLEVIVWVAL